MEFSKKLTQIRKQKGFSQEALADKIHVSRQAISKWEHEESYPDLPNLIALAEVLEISLDELCGREKNEVDVYKVIETDVEEKKDIKFEYKQVLKPILVIGLIISGFIVGKFSNQLVNITPIPNDITIYDAGISMNKDDFVIKLFTRMPDDGLVYSIELLNNKDISLQKQEMTCEFGLCEAVFDRTELSNTDMKANLVISNGFDTFKKQIANHIYIQEDDLSGLLYPNK